MLNKEERKQDILKRLRKIEGQVKGIQKMVEEDKCCGDIMIQISAIRSAINKVGGIMLDGYVKECIPEAYKNSNSYDDKLNELIDTIVKYVK
ncbi:metal-sensitive transcriptional regulator [Lutispora thermophila]|uniref:DNA-binding transcriptional regulator, FrmR family n=1 Tax=Lutispora thermophila DSM 19022 TaxID=1122184 RepID=A0A1M6HNE2_9FIRM|nr:metal-sensitive transcriptional regulator [Lutispora thermophila]SHJ23722.1 DNA-binding transcriptional regulator, FrmR family [Lutispora thermophila DSM 19022]